MHFSIITASFKQVDHLSRCAASVAAQAANVTMEHIIQDGGTGQKFDTWAAGQTFAKCFQQTDDGMYDAINRGFSKAGGEVLSWLNCDEQYLPNTLALVLEFFDLHPETDILFGDVIVVDASLRPLSYRTAITPSPKHIKSCFLPTFSAATFVRRRIVDQGILLDTSFKAIADAEWIHRLLSLGFRTAVINQPLAAFTRTGQNLGHSDSSLKEARDWRQAHRFSSKVRKQWYGGIHRLKKWRAGAYKSHTIDTSLFHGQPPRPKQISALIGGTWR